MTIIYMVSPNPIVMSKIERHMRGNKIHLLTLKSGKKIEGAIEVGNRGYNELMNTPASLEIKVYTESFDELPTESRIHQRCIPLWLSPELFIITGFRARLRKNWRELLDDDSIDILLLETRLKRYL